MHMGVYTCIRIYDISNTLISLVNILLRTCQYLPVTLKVNIKVPMVTYKSLHM